MYICVQERLYYVEVQIFLEKKYSAQQADFLSSQKTNNCPMSFPPINSRCMQRFTNFSVVALLLMSPVNL